MNTRMLVAADGSTEACGALRTARWLSETLGHEAAVLAVLEPAGLHEAGSIPLSMRTDLLRTQSDVLRGMVTDQVRTFDAGALLGSVRVEIGSPARAIAEVALSEEASLIVLGLGRHDALDRWAGREVALQVTRLTHVPVLAVPRHVTGPLRRALVGIDFSSFGSRALRALKDVLEPGAEVHLAHVIDLPSTGPGAWFDLHSASTSAAREALQNIVEELEKATDVRCTAHVQEGRAARELLELAGKLQVDVIATGSHGLGFWSRLVLGSVSTAIIRGARCAVLVVPPAEVPAELRRESPENSIETEPALVEVQR